MTELERLKIRIPSETDDSVLKEFLTTAKDVVLTHLYPFVEDLDGYSVPRKYRTLTIEIATELYNKQGAEGEISHSENGVSRTYTSTNVSPELLSQIVPYADVINGETEE